MHLIVGDVNLVGIFRNLFVSVYFNFLSYYALTAIKLSCDVSIAVAVAS